MSRSSENKNILGSPLRNSTKILIVCLLLLIIASDLITCYYTYWANRWVNTPLIIIAIILYFFAGIGFLVALNHICNINLVRYGLIEKSETRKEKKIRKEIERQESSESMASSTQDIMKKSMDKLYAEEHDEFTTEITNQTETMNQNKNFRKKHPIKLTPKPVTINSNAPSMNASQLEE